MMIIGKDIKRMLDELDEARSQEKGDVNAPYRENRSYRRSRVVWEAQVRVYFNDVTLKSEVREVPGVVRDISANGAKLVLNEPISEMVGLDLIIPKLGQFPCDAVWANDCIVGVQFKDDPATVFQHLTRVLPNA
ncbi:MAG: PilZ domain-containing protein [Sneathiella sp.]|nr:PilZ domain-containing protein [Sneathiella sp.]